MKWLKNMKKLNFRFNGFSRHNFYLAEFSRSIYSSFSISIINPVRCIGILAFTRHPGEDAAFIILNIEFYRDMENTFFSKFTHREK